MQYLRGGNMAMKGLSAVIMNPGRQDCSCTGTNQQCRSVCRSRHERPGCHHDVIGVPEQSFQWDETALVMQVGP